MTSQYGSLNRENIWHAHMVLACDSSCPVLSLRDSVLFFLLEYNIYIIVDIIIYVFE